MARDDAVVRYRQAAYLALDQLEWCAEYFRTIHKTRISKQVARNRTEIARRLQNLDRAESRTRR